MAAKIKWEATNASPPGVNGGWDFKNDVADFGDFVLGGAGSIIQEVLLLPPSTNLQGMGEYDAYPTPLAAASGTRTIGASSAPIGTLTRAWIFARTSAGGLYQPAAGSTITLDVVSASETAGAGNQVKTNIVAAQTLATFNTAFWNILPFASFSGTDRAASRPDGTVVTSWMNLYAGDAIIATLTTTGALTNQGNSLAVVIEWV